MEIEILEKSALEEGYRASVLNDPPMLHCKVAIPPYIESVKKDKFDINWQLDTIEYKWKMFWLKRKMKKK